MIYSGVTYKVGIHRGLWLVHVVHGYSYRIIPDSSAIPCYTFMYGMSVSFLVVAKFNTGFKVSVYLYRWFLKVQ
jgi:hypothetical protein